MSFELGLLITAYEEQRKPGKLERCLAIAADPRITEVVVVDDGSKDAEVTAQRVWLWNSEHGRPGLDVKCYVNPENRGVFGNKLTAIRHAQSDWVQSIDSDNWLTPAYLDVLEQTERHANRMLSPSFAMPNFDYRPMQGKVLRLNTVNEFAAWKHFLCLANTGNQCFNRRRMLDVTSACGTVNDQLRQSDYYNLGDVRGELKWRKVYDSADSFYFNKLWLEAGGEVLIVPDLHYHHEVQEFSSWAAAPKEKDLLPLFYLLELKYAAAGEPSRVVFDRFEHISERRCVVAYRTPLSGGPRQRLWLDPHSLAIRKTARE